MNFNLDQMSGYQDAVKEAVNRVIDRKQFILGEEVHAFEREFADAMNQHHAVGVGNGTDAIRIALLALGVKPGDEVISPAFNVAYTALAVHAIGAVNVFVDCDPATLLMDLDKVMDAITDKTRAIVPVHLYGQMIDMERLSQIAAVHGVMIVEDAAQAHDSAFNYYQPGHFSHAVAYSFYPTKNLGALGEAGAITTNIDIVAERARLLRDGGRTDRYLHMLPGVNSCLDEMQAAILRVKLPFLASNNLGRRAAAQSYNVLLEKLKKVQPLHCDDRAFHTYHLYVVRAADRDRLHEFLKTKGIPSLVHYPVIVPQQPCFKTALPGGPWPHAERAVKFVLSLPMFPTITPEEIIKVCSAIQEFYECHTSSH